MNWEEKLDALNNLCLHSLHMRYPGNWFVTATGLEISHGCMVSGTHGNGSSPEEAVKNYWEEITHLPDGQVLILDAWGQTRRTARWTGYMWKIFPQQPLQEKETL